MPRLLRRLCLALLLLLAQHAAALHALDHALAHRDDGKPAHALAAGCVGLHGIDEAPAAAYLPQAAPTVRPVARAQTGAPRDSTPHPAAYDSRAPPAIS